MQRDGHGRDAEIAIKQPLRWRAVDTVNCRDTVRRRTPLVRVTMVVGLLAALLSTAAATNAGATTSTTLPGPAPNQSQINATQSQVSQVETTLAQEEQQTSILDEKYDTAQQDVQNAQTALQTIATNLVHERSSVKADKRLVATDAVAAYVYGTPRDRVRLLLLPVGDTESRAQPVHEPDRRQSLQGRDLAAAVGDASCSPRRPRNSPRRHRPSRRPRRPSRSRRPTSKRPPRRSPP